MRNELEAKNKELYARVQELERRNADLEAQNSIFVVENDRKAKEMRISIENLRNDITVKER